MHGVRYAQKLLPETREWMPIYIGIFFGASTLLLIARLGLRTAKFGGAFGCDDALMLPAWLASAVFSALGVLFAHHGRLDFLPENPFIRTLMIVVLGRTPFLVSNGCTKVSVLLFCKRLVRGTGSWELRAVNWAVAFISAAYVAFFIELWAVCRPFNSSWERFDPEWSARNQGKFSCHKHGQLADYLFTSIAVASDFYATVLPAGIIWKTTLTWEKKVALTALFSVGLLVTFAGIMRTTHLIGVIDTPEILQHIFNAFVWAHLELQLGIMCACIPALSVLFRRSTMERISGWFGVRTGGPSLRQGVRQNLKAWYRARSGRSSDLESGNGMVISVRREVFVESSGLVPTTV